METHGDEIGFQSFACMTLTLRKSTSQVFRGISISVGSSDVFSWLDWSLGLWEEYRGDVSFPSHRVGGQHIISWGVAIKGHVHRGWGSVCRVTNFPFPYSILPSSTARRYAYVPQQSSERLASPLEEKWSGMHVTTMPPVKCLWKSEHAESSDVFEVNFLSGHLCVMKRPTY